MFDWLKRLAGEGQLCFEVEGVGKDGKEMVGTVKQSYIGSLATLDKDELFRKIRLKCKIDYGIIVSKITYLGDI